MSAFRNSPRRFSVRNGAENGSSSLRLERYHSDRSSATADVAAPRPSESYVLAFDLARFGVTGAAAAGFRPSPFVLASEDRVAE